MKRQTFRRIRAPLPLVFEVISELKYFPESSPTITNIERLSDVESGLGLRFRETRKMGKREASTVLEMTEYEPNSHLRFVSDEGGTIWDTLFEVKPLDDGITGLTLEMDARPYKLMPRLILPLILGVIGKAVEDDVDGTVALCEKLAAEMD